MSYLDQPLMRAALAAALPLGACASPPPAPPEPPSAPPIETAVELGLGSPLGGSSGVAPADLEAAPLRVRLRWSLLDAAEWPPAATGGAALRELLEEAPALQAAALLLAAPRAAEPLLAADGGAQRARLLSSGVEGLAEALDAARESHALLPLPAEEAALWPGSRVEFRAPGAAAVAWWPAGGEPRVALEFGADPELAVQLVLNPEAWPASGAGLFELPTAGDSLPARARWIAELELPAAGAPAQELQDAARERLVALAEQPAGAPAPSQSERARERRLTQALLALQAQETRRQALIWISRGDYPLLTELALTGDEELLAELAAGEAESSAEELAGLDLDRLAWKLERQAWLLASGRVLSGTATDTLRSSLSVLAGQAGRYPAALAAAVRAASDSDDLQRRLVQENVTLLEESDPSSRLRAADWLTRRDALPPGYDALAPRDERRAALRSAADAAAAPPASASASASASESRDR